MWRIPSPLISGTGGVFNQTFNADEYIGNLFDYLGQPGFPATVIWDIDGVDLGEIIIPDDFAPGSNFTFNCINGGRILGVGGDGGGGGADFGATGEAGEPGQAGGAAILSDGYPVFVDLDNGYLYGGGGGGGGGSYEPMGTFGYGGGGGGGGQGWTGGAGGLAGPNIGVPPPQAGTAGTRSTAGAGGLNANTITSGGNGGTFGLGGRTGISENLIAGFFGSFLYNGGTGGDAGAAFQGLNGATLTFTGSSSEATLRSQARILGETGPLYLNVPFAVQGSGVYPNMGGSTQIGMIIQSDGDVERINTFLNQTVTSWWVNGTSAGVGANYEIRLSDRTGDLDGTFTVNAAPQGTWITIDSNRQWTRTFSSTAAVAGLFEIRRNDIPAVGADDVMVSFFGKFNAESDL